jgi:hypothetical protein
MIDKKDKVVSPYGSIFLGNPDNVKRDGYYNSTDGPQAGGQVDYIPEYECTGGSPNPADRVCPHLLAPENNDNKADDQQRLLHINMPSFRDPLCPRTLFYLFTKSAQPANIRVRILQQNDPDEDDDCLAKYCIMMSLHAKDLTKSGDEISALAGQVLKINNVDEENDNNNNNCPHKEQIFVHSIHAKDAAGPTYARGLIGQDMYAAYTANLISPQDYCMSTDSHMDYEEQWDTNMIHMWHDAKNEYAILSTYVANVDQLGKTTNNNGLNGRYEVPHLCMITFTSQVRTHATKCAYNLSKPKLTNAIWGAGLSFSKCHAELKVPVDPHTPGIFDGEEFNRAARFWTYGYDIYTPHRVYVLHDYPGSQQQNPHAGSWGNGKFSPEDVRHSHYRLYTMLDIPGGEVDTQKAIQMRKSKYGLGDRRTLDQLIQFSGVDLRHKRNTIDGMNRCGNLQWVPFVEHPQGPNFIPKFDDNEMPLDIYDSSSVWYDPNNIDGSKSDLTLALEAEERKQLIVNEQEDNRQRVRMEEEEANMVHEQQKLVAKELAGGMKLHNDHKTLAQLMKNEEGNGGNDGDGGGEKKKNIRESFNGDGRGSDHREVISNAAKAAQLGDKIVRGHLRVFPVEDIAEHDRFVPPTLGEGIPRGRFSMVFQPYGKRVREGSRVGRHGVEHLPVQVKLAVFVMILGMCVALIAGGGEKRKRRRANKGV